VNDRTRSIVIWTVTAVWGANFLMGLLASFIPAIQYEVKETYNAIFMAIVGGLFTVDRLLLRNGNGNGNGKHRQDPPSQQDEDAAP
jgi:hypothetical protein